MKSPGENVAGAFHICNLFDLSSALSIHADSFLTLDDRQSKLAAHAGLKIVNIFQTTL